MPQKIWYKQLIKAYMYSSLKLSCDPGSNSQQLHQSEYSLSATGVASILKDSRYVGNDIGFFGAIDGFP